MKGVEMADFFDKVMGSINKGVDAISSKGKELIEIARLRAKIREVEATIQNRLNALGKKVFEMINKEIMNEENLKADCREITALYKKITELEEAIKQVEHEAIEMRRGAEAIMCKKCGAQNKVGDKFCSSCGSVLAVDVKSEGNN
jgi:septal ring factor EnvC (AmiA/AmiB activator)